MAKELPVYLFKLKEDESFHYDKISLVDKPAIQSDWYAFSEQNKKPEMFIVNEEKQIVAGAFMIPDLPIYRFDEQTQEEYFVQFPKEVIEKLHHNFNKKSVNKAINFMHSDRMVEAFVTENWLIEDTEKDKSKVYGFSLPIGTSFGLVKIEDKKFWDEEIKTGKLKGFSIEAYLEREDKPIKKITMSKQEEVKMTALPDGEYTLADGTKIMVANGMVEVVEAKEEAPPSEEEMAEPAPSETPTNEAPTEAPAMNEEMIKKIVDEQLSEMKTEVSNALAELTQKIAEVEASKMKTEEESKKMREQLNAFSEIPAVKGLMETFTDEAKNEAPKHERVIQSGVYKNIEYFKTINPKQF